MADASADKAPTRKDSLHVLAPEITIGWDLAAGQDRSAVICWCPDHGVCDACGASWRTLHNRFGGRTEPMGYRPTEVKKGKRK